MSQTETIKLTNKTRKRGDAIAEASIKLAKKRPNISPTDVEEITAKKCNLYDFEKIVFTLK